MVGIHTTIMLGGVMVFFTNCVLSSECAVKVGKTSRQVAFEAQLAEYKKMIIPEDVTITFPTVLLNDGDGYNPDTGIFTAPISGVYTLNALVCHAKGEHMVFAIMKGKEQLIRSYISSIYSSGCGPVSINVKLLEGDEIKVVSKYEYSMIYVSDNLMNTFNGHLLYT